MHSANSTMLWFGRYEGWLRMLARGVRNNDKECIMKAAGLFDLMLPDKCIVVPMPSHTGVVSYMGAVADAMPFGKRVVMPTLTCDPHESSYSAKKAGLAPVPFSMRFDARQLNMAPSAYLNVGIYVIDNVICSGTTASAALRAIQDASGLDATVCALAYSPWR